MNKDAAENADSSDWFDCNVTSVAVDASSIVKNPYDTSCLVASLQGSEAVCRGTTDEEDQACSWCVMPGSQTGLCLTSDQAAIAAQTGADCSSDQGVGQVDDPYDTSCLAASLQADEATCEATTDEDGQACEWCALNDGQVNLCLTSEQAAIAEQIGADCNEEVVEEDPYDTSCLAASLQTG